MFASNVCKQCLILCFNFARSVVLKQRSPRYHPRKGFAIDITISNQMGYEQNTITQAAIRAKNYQMEYAEVLQAALHFASSDENPTENPVATPDTNTAPSLDKRIKIRYLDLTAINLVKDMDGFITRWITSDKNG